MKITYIGDNEDPVTLVCPHTGAQYTAKRGQAIEVAEITGICATRGPLWKVVGTESQTTKTTVNAHEPQHK